MLNYKDEYYVLFEDDEQEEIMDRLIVHINQKGTGSVTEYILDFCDTNSYRIEEIAYMINANKTFKNILKQDCLHYGIFRSDKEKPLDEW